MNKITALFTLLILAGCAATVHVKHGEPFSLHKKATVVNQSSSQLVKKARVSNDTLVVVDYFTGQESRMPLSSVNKVVFRSRADGALRWLWMGPLIGLAAGAASLADCQDKMCGIGIIAFPLIGLMYGPAFGALIGVERNVVFDPN